MDNFSTITIIQALIIFVVVMCTLSIIFSDERKKSKVKRRNIYSQFSPKAIVTIIAAALGATYFLNSISSNLITSSIVFVLLVTLIPYSLLNAQERINRELLFDDVVLYCQNTAMLLKQTHNVYASLSKVVEDLSTSLKDDIKDLIYCLDTDKEKVKESMTMIEHNYPYSCIKNLNVIIMHMQFEHANINDSLLIDYQEDLDALEKDVRDNKLKRKSLRITYITITAISIAAYWFFVSQLKSTFSEGFETDFYKTAHTLFILFTLLSLFLVDRYFNLTTTKE